jgi:hypothetical protein
MDWYEVKTFRRYLSQPLEIETELIYIPRCKDPDQVAKTLRETFVKIMIMRKQKKRYEDIFKEYQGDHKDIQKVKDFLPDFLKKYVDTDLSKLLEFIKPSEYDIISEYQKVIFRKTYSCPGCRYEKIDDIEAEYYFIDSPQTYFSDDKDAFFTKRKHKKYCKFSSEKYRYQMKRLHDFFYGPRFTFHHYTILSHTFTGQKEQDCEFKELF